MSESGNSIGQALTIVTAADEAYAGSLARLLHSLERCGVTRVIVYDLGLSPRRRAFMARRFPWAEVRDFDFSAYPPHMALAARTYAWKPLVVTDAASKVDGLLLWLDSACVVRTCLDEPRRDLEACGLYVLHGQSPLRARMDPAVACRVEAEPPLLDHPEVVSGVIGFDPRRPPVGALLAQWRAWALDPRMIPPRTPGHNPDQALLSLLVLRARAAGEVRLPAHRDVDISAPAPARWISTREKVPSWWPLSLAALAGAGYRVWKGLDQLAHRFRRFKATRINGLHRWTKEHFQVFVLSTSHAGPAGGEGRGRADLSARPRLVPAPRWSYYADPFLWRRDGHTWLFVEEFRYLEHAARLVSLPLDDEGRPGRPRPLELFHGTETSVSEGLAMAARHWSFPFLFDGQDGRLYLVPETCAVGAVDLFVCEAFPHRWRWVRRLLDGVDAADTMVGRRDGRWWLFTSVRSHSEAPRALEIHHAANLLTDPLIAHPVNGERRFSAAPHGTGRCGGTWARTDDGAWLRPVQASMRYYGEGLRYMRIDVLTPDAFEESPFDGKHPLATLAARLSPHHLAALDDLVALDARTRVSHGQHVRHRARDTVENAVLLTGYVPHL